MYRHCKGPSGRYYAEPDEEVDLADGDEELKEEDIVRIRAKDLTAGQKHMHSFFTTAPPTTILGELFARMNKNSHAFSEPKNSYKIDCTIKRVSTDSESGEEEKSAASELFEQCKMQVQILKVPG